MLTYINENIIAHLDHEADNNYTHFVTPNNKHHKFVINKYNQPERELIIERSAVENIFEIVHSFDNCENFEITENSIEYVVTFTDRTFM